MSSFTTKFTFAAGGSSSSVERFELPLVFGVIHKIRIRFPPGPRGLVKLAIYHGSIPVAPTDPGATFEGDNETIEFDEHFEITRKPTFLYILGWNEDTIYSHDAYVQVFVLPKEVLLPIAGEMGMMNIIRTFLTSSKESKRATERIT